MPQAARNIYVSAASADAADAELLHLRADYHRIRARRELPSRADRLAPAPEPVTKPAVPRKRHVGRWVDAPVLMWIAVATIACGAHAVAQDSSALERCLRTGAVSGLEGDAMVKGCEREVLEWTRECERLNANDARGAAELCAWSVIDMGHDAQDAADLKDIGE